MTEHLHAWRRFGDGPGQEWHRCDDCGMLGRREYGRIVAKSVTTSEQRANQDMAAHARRILDTLKDKP